jgi:hypothetical protein
MSSLAIFQSHAASKRQPEFDGVPLSFSFFAPQQVKGQPHAYILSASGIYPAKSFIRLDLGIAG